MRIIGIDSSCSIRNKCIFTGISECYNIGTPFAEQYSAQLDRLQNQINVLPPTWFARAENSLDETKAELDKGKEISKILDHVAEGRAQLQADHLRTAEHHLENIFNMLS